VSALPFTSNRDAVNAERDRQRQRRQDVCGVENAERQLVAHVGPGDFAPDLDLETLALERAELIGQDDRRAVDDRDVADLDLGFLDRAHAYATPQKQKASRSAGTSADRSGRHCPNGRPSVARRKIRRRPAIGPSAAVQHESCQRHYRDAF
jgi:hypothetical protein